VLQVLDPIPPGLGRDEFMARLDADGIETRPVFYPMHVLPPYLDPAARFPVADRLAAQGVNLPTHGMLTEDDVDYIVSRIRASLQQASVALPRRARQSSLRVRTRRSWAAAARLPSSIGSASNSSARATT